MIILTVSEIAELLKKLITVTGGHIMEVVSLITVVT